MTQEYLVRKWVIYVMVAAMNIYEYFGYCAKPFLNSAQQLFRSLNIYQMLTKNPMEIQLFIL